MEIEISSKENFDCITYTAEINLSKSPGCIGNVYAYGEGVVNLIV